LISDHAASEDFSTGGDEAGEAELSFSLLLLLRRRLRADENDHFLFMVLGLV
jgi:hypothetical protein